MTGDDDPDVDVIWDGQGSLAPDDHVGYGPQRTHPLLDAAMRWGWGERDKHHAHADRLGQARAHKGPKTDSHTGS